MTKKSKKQPKQFTLRGKLFYEYRIAIAERDTARAEFKTCEVVMQKEADKEIHAPLIQKQNELTGAIRTLGAAETTITDVQKQIAKRFGVSIKDLEKYAINEYSGQMTFVPDDA